MYTLPSTRLVSTLMLGLLLTGCEGRWPFGDPEDMPAANTAPVARVNVTSVVVTTRDLITVDGATSTDLETPGELEYAMDRNGDGQVDTPWSMSPVLQFSRDAGEYFAYLVVRDPQGLEGRTQVHLYVEPDLRDLVITPHVSVKRGVNSNGIGGNVFVEWELELVANGPPRLDSVEPAFCWVLDAATGDTLLVGTPGFVEVVPPGIGDWVYSNSTLRVSGVLSASPVPLEDWPCLGPLSVGVELRGGQCEQVLNVEWGPFLLDCEP